MKKKKMKIGFVGGGNMGHALIAALIRKKLFRPQEIGVSEPDADRRRILKKLHASLFRSNVELTESSSVLLLAIKPQQMREVLREITPALRKHHLVLSIAAGLDTGFFQKNIPAGTRFIRIMPNSPALIGEGASALYAGPTATVADRRLALKIFEAAGKAVLVPKEEWIDIVTALSGSGPAFVYEFIRALLSAGTRLGLPSTLGAPLILQTLIGSVHLAQQSRESLETLIEKVASKGGTTEVGLATLRNLGFTETVSAAIRAATNRARELSSLSK